MSGPVSDPWELAIRYRPLARRRARGRNRNGGPAELDDLTSSALLDLHAAALRWDPDAGASFAGFSRWFGRTLRRTALDLAVPVRVPNKGAEVLRAPDLDDGDGDGPAPVIDLLAGDEPGPELEAVTREERRRILAAVAELPDPDRTVIELRYLDPSGPASIEAVATHLGWSRYAVRVGERDGLRRLRVELDEQRRAA